MIWQTIVGLSLIIFIIIASSYNTEVLQTIDTAVANVLGDNRFLEPLHVIGNTDTIIILTLVSIIILIAVKKAWGAAFFTAITVLFGLWFNQFLKSIFERPRPDVLDQLTTYSFPSGHSTGTTITLLTIIFVYHQQFFKEKKFYTIYTVGLFVAMLVALSRVAGVRHFFTDVVAGVCLGITYVFVATVVYKKLIR